jgi:transcriptional regulator with XRE-family HTH domain
MAKEYKKVELEGDLPSKGGRQSEAVPHVTGDAVPLGSVIETIAKQPDAISLLGTTPADLSIGLRLRQVRRARGLTQAALAELTRLPQSMISDIEKGKGRDGPSFRVLEKVAGSLGLDVALIDKKCDVVGELPVFDPSVHVISSTQPASEIGREPSPAYALMFLRAVVDDGVLMAVREKIFAWMSGKAGSFRTGRPSVRLHFDDTLTCQFWRMNPYAQTKFATSAMTIFISIRRSDDFCVRSLDGAMKVSEEIYLIPEKGTFDVENRGDQAMSLMSIPAAKFLAATAGDEILEHVLG